MTFPQHWTKFHSTDDIDERFRAIRVAGIDVFRGLLLLFEIGSSALAAREAADAMALARLAKGRRQAQRRADGA